MPYPDTPENDTPPSYTPIDETNSSLTPDTNYSKRPSLPPFICVNLMVYYRTYVEDGAIPSKTPVDSSDPFLGRIKARSVPPPHTVKSLKLRIAKMEDINLNDPTSISIFLTPEMRSPMADADKFTILNRTGPGSTPQEPLALVAKISDSERSAMESRSLAEPSTTIPGIRYRTSIPLLFFS